ncbi:MAG: TonB-dependent receptor [Candidatus Brocadia sp.]|nr:TonB-dependent receptor [Candidatus Brocadia sp.]
MEAAFEEEFATEAIWFGSGEEITIATRHEIPISKAPSIVTVITAEEIKNSGYRTFVEILRTVPGFEILKTGDFGVVIPVVRGLTSTFGNKGAFLKKASLKLLYGEAFRAPTFNEMFTRGQTALQGNEDLDPETIRTYEIGLSYQFNKYITSSVNYFYNDIEGLIVLRLSESNPNTQRFENFGDARVQGIEMETRVEIMKDNYIFMNYTFQNPEDNRGNDLPSTAQHYCNFGVNAHYWKYINTNISTFVSGKRSREAGDPREDLPAYALVNLSVIGKEFFKTMEVQGTVFNLLDKDYSDPGPVSIPDDLPRPGRTFFVGLSHQF